MCIVCERIQMIMEDADPFFVKELETGYVVLGDVQHFRGDTLFLCRQHGMGLSDECAGEMRFVEKAVGRAFGAEWTECERSESDEGHLCWHLIPRREGEEDVGMISPEELLELKRRLENELDRIVDVTGVELRTKRLMLRPFEQGDLEDFHRYASVDGVGQPAGWLPHRNMAETQRILDMFMSGRSEFAIVHDGRTVGSVGIKKCSEATRSAFGRKRGCELGFVLAKDCWGQGFMPEAVRRVIGWLFEEQGMEYITCEHFVTNGQSKRVQEKCGFRYLTDSVYETGYGTVEPVRVNVLERRDWK